MNSKGDLVGRWWRPKDGSRSRKRRKGLPTGRAGQGLSSGDKHWGACYLRGGLSSGAGGPWGQRSWLLICWPPAYVESQPSPRPSFQKQRAVEEVSWREAAWCHCRCAGCGGQEIWVEMLPRTLINWVDLGQFLSFTVPQLNKDNKPELWSCWAE